MKIFDTHSHYDDEAFNEDLNIIMQNNIDSNVDKIMLACAELDECYKKNDFTNLLNEKYNIDFYYNIGIHPDIATVFFEDKIDLESFKKDFYELLKKNYNENDRFKAVGEIGLDYYRKEMSDELKSFQKNIFDFQISIANKLKLPIVVHSREACEDTINVLNNNRAEKESIMHCYSYSKESAREFLNLGYNFGIGGVLTFKNAEKLKEVVNFVPIDKLVTETDCPYLSPEPFRGKKNFSANIVYVIKKIAEIKNMDVEETANILYNNALRIYNIK